MWATYGHFDSAQRRYHKPIVEGDSTAETGRDREEAGELERNYERERLQTKGSDVESGCSLTNNDRFQGMLESMVWPISSCTEDEQMHFSHYSMTEWVS